MAYAATGSAAQRFDARAAHVSGRLGARQLGYNITAVPPGMCAFPYHNHRVNEEMFLVLEGTGEVRIGSERYPVRRGDIVACPAGGRETAHQFINTGNDELKFLAVSTRRSPEIAEYPDSDKFAIYAEYPANADGTKERFRFVGREGQGADYWDGE